MGWKTIPAIPPTWPALVLLALAAVAQVDAHENHAPLPTKGVTIAGDTIMLSDKARKAIGLTVEKVQLDKLHRLVQINARVELPWHQQAMIASLVPGKIAEVLVRPGETVVPGQELARLESAELENLQLAVRQARAELQLARRLVDQRADLGRQGAIAGKDLIEAEAVLARRSTQLEISRQKLLALGLNSEALQQVEESANPLAYISITSPIGGIITHADVRVGQVVQPTEHLYHVADPTSLWIVGDVLESDLRHLRQGQQVEAVFAARPDSKVIGAIDHLRLKMDPQTRTQAVVIAVDNRDGKLRPGMAGHARVSVQVAQEAIICPSDAVIESRTGHYLLVQRMPGKYENRPVKLGLEQGGKVEVLEGAFPGDQVVVVGNALLAALLGNEHKARTTDNPPKQNGPENTSAVITVAHAAVELPTDQQAYATSRVEGRIQRILIEPSQKVEAGQVLAEVESLSVRNVQLDLLESLGQWRVVTQSLERLIGSEIAGVTPQRRIWELQSEAETLRLRVETVKRQLAFLGLDDPAIAELEKATLTGIDVGDTLQATVAIRAPATGWIVGFHVVPGQVVHPEDTLFEIHDLSKVWVKGFVFERHAAQIELGQIARVTFAAFPNLQADGRIVRIAPTMEENEQVLPVWVEVANPHQLLKQGMFARITIRARSPVEQAENGIARLKAISPGN